MEKPSRYSHSDSHPRRYRLAALSILLLLPGFVLLAQMGTTGSDDAPKIPDYQLDSLVAPIALYPDQLLSQVLVASTYPLEITQLQKFLQNNPYLKDKALGDGVELKPWDASIKAMATFPDVVKRLADDIRWTTDLGNAFLAQESDVMDAIQRMRLKAQEKGTLKTSEQQIVETEMLDGGNQAITIEPADPETVYVPYYDPTMAYGALAYPYPAIYYPPPGYYAPGSALAFFAGVALGKAWNGGWGYNCSWGSRDININNNNKYVRNSPKNLNRTQGTLNQSTNAVRANKWQHNPTHRGGTPYANRQLANKYGNLTGNVAGNVGSNLGAANRVENNLRSGNASGQLRNQVGSGTTSLPRQNVGSVGSGDRIGNQNASGFGNAGAFNGGNRDFSRASINRGVSSMSPGGFQGGGGGGFGGGGRGGGGGRRR